MPATPPFAPYELVRRLVDDLLGDEVEKEALRLKDGFRSRSLWRTLGWRAGLLSMCAGTAPLVSPELVPGRDLATLAGDDEKLLLLPPKRDEKKAALDVGVTVGCCMSQSTPSPSQKPPRNHRWMRRFVIHDRQNFRCPVFVAKGASWSAK